MRNDQCRFEECCVSGNKNQLHVNSLQETLHNGMNFSNEYEM